MKKNVMRAACFVLAVASGLGAWAATPAAIDYTSSANYSDWAYATTILNWRESSATTFHTSTVSPMNADGTEGTSFALNNYWSDCFGNTSNKFVLRYDATGYKQQSDAQFSPMTVGGLIVESYADDSSTAYCLYGSSGSNRPTNLGFDNTTTKYKFEKSFDINRTGTTSIRGTAQVEVASGATFKVQANTSFGATLTSGSTLVMSGEGQMSVGSGLTASGATLDYTALSIRTSTDAFISGNLTIDSTTTLKIPSTVAEGDSYTLCTGTLTGGESGTRTIYVGSEMKTVKVTFTDNKLSYEALGSLEIATDTTKTAAEVTSEGYAVVKLTGGTLDLSAVESLPSALVLSADSTGGTIKIASSTAISGSIMACATMPSGAYAIQVGDTALTSPVLYLSSGNLCYLKTESVTFVPANDTDWTSKTLTIQTPLATATENISFANDSKYKQTVTEGDVTVALVTDAAAGTRVFGLHALDGSSAGIGAISRDIYLKVSGGTPGVISGGEDAGWNATKTVVTGDTLVNVGGSTVVDYVYGAGLGGGSGVTTTGDIGVVIDGDAQVKGSAVVGWQGRHNSTAKVTGNTTMLVKNVQTYDSSTATADVGNGSCNKGLIVGGGVCWGNGGVSTIGGNSAVIVDIGENATGTFAKTLIGGSYHISSWGTMTVSGNSSVTISAPSAVTFSKEITGGGYTLGSSSVVSGNSSVTINGGTYTGTIYAGGNHSAATVGGTATLNLNGGTFTGAALKGGTATGAKTIAVGGDVTMSASTTISDFSSLTIAENKTLTINADSDATMSLATTGSGEIAKTGTGTLTLSDLVSGATYGFTVSAGSLNLSGDASGMTVKVNSSDGTLNVGTTRPTVNYQAGKLKLTASSTELAAGKITLTTTEDSAAASTDITTVVDEAGNTYTITDASKTDNVVTLTLQTITPITKDSTSKNTSDAIGSFTSGTLVIQGADSADDAYDVVFDAEVPSGVSVSVSGYVNLTVDGTTLTTLPYSQISFESGAVVKMATGDSYTVPAGITVTSTLTSGTITNNGTLNLSAGTYTLTNNGTVNVAGDSTITLTNTGTFNVTSGTVTMSASGVSLQGTINIPVDTEFVIGANDQVKYDGSCTFNVRGTLNMGNYRQTFGSGNVVNAYAGATITGTGTASKSASFDPYSGSNQVVINAKAETNNTGTVYFYAPVRSRANWGICIEEGMTLEMTKDIVNIDSCNRTFIKTGAGAMTFSGNVYSTGAFSISAGTFSFETGTADDPKTLVFAGNMGSTTVTPTINGNGTINMTSATIDLGTSATANYIKAKIVAYSGTSTLKMGMGNTTEAFCTNDTKDKPCITVNSGATLNLAFKDMSGWIGNVCTYGWIANNGTLNIEENGGSRYFRNHLVLKDSSTTAINGTSYVFRPYGGTASETTAQIIADGDATINGTGTIEFNVNSSGGTSGCGITVADGKTLTIENTLAGSEAVAKYGEGTLVLSGTSTYAGTITINAGTIKSVNELTVASGKTAYTVKTTTETVDDVTYNIYSLNHDACDVYYVDGYLGDSSDKYTVTSDGTTATVLVAGDTLVIDSKSSRTQIWVATTLPSEIEKIRIDRDVEMTAGASGSILGGADITISTGVTLTIGVNAWNTTAVASTAKFTFADGGKIVVNCDTFEGTVTTTAEGKHVYYDSSTKTYSVINDAPTAGDGEATIETTGTGADAVATVTPVENAESITVTVPTDYTGKVALTADAVGITTISGTIDAANLLLKVSYSDTTATYAVLKLSDSKVVLNPDATVTIGTGDEAVTVKLQPAVSTMTVGTVDESDKASMTVATIPGLYYGYKTATAVDELDTADATGFTQATGTSMTVSCATNDATVQFFRVVVSTSGK